MRARLTRFNLIKIYSEIKTRYEMGGMMDRSLTGEKHLVMPIDQTHQSSPNLKKAHLAFKVTVNKKKCVCFLKSRRQRSGKL